MCANHLLKPAVLPTQTWLSQKCGATMLLEASPHPPATSAPAWCLCVPCLLSLCCRDRHNPCAHRQTESTSRLSSARPTSCPQMRCLQVTPSTRRQCAMPRDHFSRMMVLESTAAWVTTTRQPASVMFVWVRSKGVAPCQKGGHRWGCLLHIFRSSLGVGTPVHSATCVWMGVSIAVIPGGGDSCACTVWGWTGGAAARIRTQHEVVLSRVP